MAGGDMTATDCQGTEEEEGRVEVGLKITNP